MPLAHLALVVESGRVTANEASEVAAALQRQVSRDFAPIWGLDATLDLYQRLDEVPPGYWPLIVRDHLPMRGVIGIHLDSRDQPYALIRHTPTWSLTTSHEALEMIADPFGSRLQPGGSPLKGQGIVEFLVEVCDPCGGPRFGYTVNGVLVSDFITPSYYEPLAVEGVRYSFSGAVTRPREILPGGYLAWREPSTGEWWAWDHIGRDRPRFRSLGRQPKDQRPLRERVDARGIMDVLYTGLPSDDQKVRIARERYESSRAASRARARDLHDQIRRLIQGAEPPATAFSDPGDGAIRRSLARPVPGSTRPQRPGRLRRAAPRAGR